VCCSVSLWSYAALQCVAVCCSVLQCVAMCCIVLHCVAVCCSVLQCVLHCVAVCVAVCLAVWSTLLKVSIGGLFGVIQVSFVGLFCQLPDPDDTSCVQQTYGKKPTLTLQNVKRSLYSYFYRSPLCVSVDFYKSLLQKHEKNPIFILLQFPTVCFYGFI